MCFGLPFFSPSVLFVSLCLQVAVSLLFFIFTQPVLFNQVFCHIAYARGGGGLQQFVSSIIIISLAIRQCAA